jgi:DNA-binding NarL/FixJ family response regulator
MSSPEFDLECAMRPVRILVADDHELVLHGIASIVSRAHPEWEIVGLASSGADAIEMGRTFRPSLAVLDLSMPDQTGLDVAESLIAEVPGIRILILTSLSSEPLLRRIHKAGVHGCVAKRDAPTHIVGALERILAGETFLARPDVAKAARASTSSESVPSRYLLTVRELTVMRLLAEGKTNKATAAELGLSVRTVESHRANILHKLGIESIGELVRLAVRDKLI